MIDARVTRDRLLNAGHFLDHMFMLVYTTAVITIAAEQAWSYGELIALATPGFVLFGALSLPFGWAGDRFGRHRLMVAFFVGIGLAAVATGLADDRWQLALGLSLIGIFAAIYHPVGIPMLVQGLDRPGRVIGLNGVFGNLGVAAAPLLTGALIAALGWRAAFVVPGLVSIALGAVFWLAVPRDRPLARRRTERRSRFAEFRPGWVGVLAVIGVVTLGGGIIFNTTTVVLPKLFEERPIIEAGAGVLGYTVQASLVYAAASMAQIVSGRAVDRLSAKWMLGGLIGAQAVAMALLSVAEGPAAFAVSLVLMLAVFGQIPIVDTIVTRYVPDHYRGRVFSLKYLINLTIGASAVPMIALFHSSWGGFEAMFLALGAAALVMSVAALALPRQPADLAAMTDAPGRAA